MQASALRIVISGAAASPVLAYLGPFADNALLKFVLGTLASLLVAAKLHWMKFRRYSLRLLLEGSKFDSKGEPK